MPSECHTEHKSWLNNSITDDIRDSVVIFFTPILALVEAFSRALGIATDIFVVKSRIAKFAPTILFAAMIFDLAVLLFVKSLGPQVAPSGFAASVWHILRLSH